MYKINDQKEYYFAYNFNREAYAKIRITFKLLTSKLLLHVYAYIKIHKIIKNDFIISLSLNVSISK